MRYYWIKKQEDDYTYIFTIQPERLYAVIWTNPHRKDLSRYINFPRTISSRRPIISYGDIIKDYRSLVNENNLQDESYLIPILDTFNYFQLTDPFPPDDWRYYYILQTDERFAFTRPYSSLIINNAHPVRNFPIIHLKKKPLSLHLQQVEDGYILKYKTDTTDIYVFYPQVLETPKGYIPQVSWIELLEIEFPYVELSEDKRLMDILINKEDCKLRFMDEFVRMVLETKHLNVLVEFDTIMATFMRFPVQGKKVKIDMENTGTNLRFFRLEWEVEGGTAEGYIKGIIN